MPGDGAGCDHSISSGGWPGETRYRGEHERLHAGPRPHLEAVRVAAILVDVGELWGEGPDRGEVVGDDLVVGLRGDREGRVEGQREYLGVTGPCGCSAGRL